MLTIDLAEKSLLPDWLIRIGIRRLLNKRLKGIQADSEEEHESFERELIEELSRSALALDTDAANSQHYEVPAEFFYRVLGPRLKYSCCLYAEDDATLGQAEDAMLKLTCQRAELTNGQQILELGCGWGSLTLWMAEQYPGSHITAVSNSSSQREFILKRAQERGLSNVDVITADMRTFSIDKKFDRIVSVEMFEHMRNYAMLLNRISSWLNERGKLFVHIFCHRSSTYLFETEGDENWMGRHFFTGGMMPSISLLSRFADDLVVEDQWEVNGEHYWRTSEDWLRNLDRDRRGIESLFAQSMSSRKATIVTQRWRMFFLACAELFRYNEGKEWFVGHYRLCQKS